MSQVQQTHLFPSLRLDSLLRSIHLTKVTAKPWIPPPTVAVDHSLVRLRAAVAQLGLPLASTASPCFSQSRADLARGGSNIESWLDYLPRNCVRRMVLDGWHWTT